MNNPVHTPEIIPGEPPNNMKQDVFEKLYLNETDEDDAIFPDTQTSVEDFNASSKQVACLLSKG